ncbi:TonB-dependent receptor [Pelagerythrobacter sp.]|uniref:TonB-dependent receptor n=1 Tax=Pelagerythrobacter sp. TaxID=2800702 RepID=UPI0035B29B62
MKLKYLLAASVAGLSVTTLMPTAAQAQSTGSVDFENNEIIVTGERATDVGGIDIPAEPKAKQVLTEEAIRRQRPGQAINDTINLVPGVSFQNNDPWGASGGSFTIRGFADDRISQTLDGLPLNDSGNYALYTSQQVDPEILESVNVNLGSTDVDSPTASAVGGTINLRTKEPLDYFHLTTSLSYGNILADGAGDRPYMRGFAMVDTGDLTGIGTKAFFSASYLRYDNPFNNYGVVEKQQYNGRIFQELGSNGDFVAVAGHYNEARNNFFGSFSITELQAFDKGDRFYDINYPCTVDSVNGVFETPEQVAADGYVDPDGVNGCGAEFDRRYNPSNTGNIRGSSRFSLGDSLTLTVDPSYQYVKANGGGNEELLEGTRSYNGVEYTGFLRGGYYFGRDLNGDGDMLDEISGFDPSQTQTHRYGVISNLIYDISDDHRVRLAYTYDRARHRQTGQTSMALLNGEIPDVFPVNDPLLTADGFELNKRDRRSYAILHQVSGEYRGNFGPLTAVVGLRAPFFKRELNQNCFTTSASGFVDCLGDQDATAYAAANPNAVAPVSVEYDYDKLLPNVGFTYDLGQASVFANYAKGLSVPGTDELYDSLFFFGKQDDFQPVPETTDSFDLGMRYQMGRLQAQVAGWYTRYQNRRAIAYDPVLDESIARNLGTVDKYGIDVSVAYQPTPSTLFYVFGSYNDSEIKDDVQVGEDDAGAPIFIDTSGNRESGVPKFSVGGRAQFEFGPVEFGIQAKHTGERFVNDINSLEVDGYTLVDADIRIRLGEYINGRDAAIQINLTNILDEFYIGGFGGDLDGVGFAQIGPPRAASISLLLGY